MIGRIAEIAPHSLFGQCVLLLRRSREDTPVATSASSGSISTLLALDNSVHQGKCDANRQKRLVHSRIRRPAQTSSSVPVVLEPSLPPRKRFPTPISSALEGIIGKFWHEPERSEFRAPFENDSAASTWKPKRFCRSEGRNSVGDNVQPEERRDRSRSRIVAKAPRSPDRKTGQM